MKNYTEIKEMLVNRKINIENITDKQIKRDVETQIDVLEWILK